MNKEFINEIFKGDVVRVLVSSVFMIVGLGFFLLTLVGAGYEADGGISFQNDELNMLFTLIFIGIGGYIRYKHKPTTSLPLIVQRAQNDIISLGILIVAGTLVLLPLLYMLIGMASGSSLILLIIGIIGIIYGGYRLDSID